MLICIFLLDVRCLKKKKKAVARSIYFWLQITAKSAKSDFDCPDVSPLTAGSPFGVFSTLLFSSSTTIKEKDGRTFTFNWGKGGGKQVRIAVPFSLVTAKNPTKGGTVSPK